MVGMIEASTTRRFWTVWTWQCWSPTAIESLGGPIRAVPQGWNWVETAPRDRRVPHSAVGRVADDPAAPGDVLVPRGADRLRR
jgi:hypothetical protein